MSPRRPAAPAGGPDPELVARARSALGATLAYSRARDYAGHSKHDALASPLLARLCGGTRLTRLIAIQAVMRAPVNLRPLLGVPRSRNPKGIGLFAHALLDLYRAEGREEDRREAARLLGWLLEHPAEGFRGLSWGYPYPWQDVGFFAPPGFPNRVVTSWIGLALAEGARATGEPAFLEALPRIAEFLRREPRVLFASPEELCLSYVPDPSVDWAVMDVPALAGAFLAEAAALTGERELLGDAGRLLRWVARRQTEYGAWYYTHPPGASHITHDNYHTAIILDCLDRYRHASADQGFDAAYWKGLGYYRDHLFTPSWAPRWMNDREYPYDVHGAASAILCFVRAAGRDPAWWAAAEGVLRWTLDTLYDPRGFFYYQRTRWVTKRFLLMRWANGWMCRALAALVRAAAEGTAEARD